MAYTDFVAVIDLGTAHIVGMVGTKNPNSGALTIIAQEVENAGTGIRRGTVFNIEETATTIKRLVKKLEAQLNGGRIAKVYVGIGGQSIHSINHSVIKEVAEEGVVTEEIKDILLEECRAYQPKGLDVLDIVSPTYYVDNKLESNPVGIPFTKIEARFKLIVGRPSLRRHIENSIAERAQIKVAGVLISPLALADVVLSEDEKQLGCALINFGAGVTSLTVYKGGNLVNLCVIPFGGHLITRDLTSLSLIESEAERIKITYSSAIVDKDDDSTIQVNSIDGVGVRELRMMDVNYVVESRINEILENVFAQLEAGDTLKSLGAGVVITGGASNLRNLVESMQKRLKMEVRYASMRKGILDKSPLALDPSYAVAIGLLMQGDENCALEVVPPKTEALFPDLEEEKEAEREKERERERERKAAAKKEADEQAQKKKRGIKDIFNKGIDRIGSLFDEDDMR